MRVVLVALLLTGASLIAGAVAQPSAPASTTVNPIADRWRPVRDGVSGVSAVAGAEAGVLIQSGGQRWRQLRNGALSRYGGQALLLTVGALGLFFLWRGRLRLARPRSGHTVLRWSRCERVLHWATAALFLLLAATGLGLLYGRALLIPVAGHENFAGFAEWAKTLHNLIGPLFILGLALMLIAWLRDNLPERTDIEWLRAYGGMIGDRHPPAGRINAGEKLWFWLLAVGGTAVCGSGLLLDFPILGQPRWLLQDAHMVHAVAALMLIVGALGHIYIGSIGTEGALEGMVSGRVDAAWAQQHHDLWYAAMQSEKRTGTANTGYTTSSTRP